MDQNRFDGLTRALGTGASRRHLGRALAGGGLAALLSSPVAPLPVGAKKKKRHKKRKTTQIEPKLDPQPTPATPSCTPNCADRSCGNDGCGGSCGTCGSDQVCRGGTCCVPEPRSATCGGRCGTWTNNCGQPVVCSTCPAGQQCLSNGSCAVVCSVNGDCPSGGGCSNPSVEGVRHCVVGPLQPYVACPSTADCPPDSHCQDIGFGGVCITLRS
jgi:hypothetical protein